MISKTPQFDTALDVYFSKLELDEKGGQWRICRFSGEKFYVRPDDIEFYKKMRVPLPTLSPKERVRRKIAFLNIYNLFKIKSAYSGKQIIAAYPPDTQHIIYEHDVWKSGDWDARNFALEYVSTLPFFEQFQKLHLAVPRPNLDIIAAVNSEYANNSTRIKNCYLIFESLETEDSAYSIALINSRNCIDCFHLINVDTCYNSFWGRNLWKCFWVDFSYDCRESYFLYDCRNCESCFGCVNLRNKKYCFFNEQLTKDEYKRRVHTIDLGNREILAQMQKKFQALKTNAVYREHHNKNSFQCVGDFIDNSKNCYWVFSTLEGENLAYAVGGIKNRDSYDIIGGIGIEHGYETGTSWGFGLKFSYSIRTGRDIEYSALCANSHDLFGCIGLQNASFCIFNKQYSEGEYWKKVDEIKIAMFKAGEYGEFFPPQFAPMPYNISVASSYIGYDDYENARRYGYTFRDIPVNHQDVDGAINADAVPLHIQDVGDDILSRPIFDTESGRYFRIIKPELEFYRAFRIPVPLSDPFFRLEAHRKKFGPIIFAQYERVCARCKKKIFITRPPEYQEKNIYCERCCQEEIG